MSEVIVIFALRTQEHPTQKGVAPRVKCSQSKFFPDFSSQDYPCTGEQWWKTQDVVSHLQNDRTLKMNCPLQSTSEAWIRHPLHLIEFTTMRSPVSRSTTYRRLRFRIVFQAGYPALSLSYPANVRLKKRLQFAQ